MFVGPDPPSLPPALWGPVRTRYFPSLIDCRDVRPAGGAVPQPARMSKQQWSVSPRLVGDLRCLFAVGGEGKKTFYARRH